MFKKASLNLNTYGYDYSKYDFLGLLVMFSISMIVICYLHKLNAIYTLLVLITLVFLLPFLITSYFKYKHEKLKFEEYCKYFEYMKLYFKTYKKINIAMENVLPLFDEKSKMYCCLSEAIDIINTTGDYKKALNIIDEHYHNSYLRRFHDLLITGEKQGSDTVYENLDLINFESWKQDIQKHQGTKKMILVFLYFIFGFSLILSVYGANMCGDSLTPIFINPQYQLYTFVDIECMFMMFVYCYGNLINKKWIRSDD